MGTGAVLALSVSMGGLSACTPEPRPLPDVPDAPSGADGGPAAASGAATWSYQGDSGPEKWGTLRAEWAACAEPGQSPIDVPLDALSAAASPPELALALDLPPSPLTLRTSAQTVTLVGAANSAVTVDGQRVPVQEVELHVPAEHRLGGTSFDAELVFRAQGQDGRPILLSVLYRAGAANPAWAALLQALPKAGPIGDRPLAGPVDLGALVPRTAPVLAYEGSLSMPPCTKGALRLIVAQVGEISSDQVVALRQAVPQSARPIVDRGERAITLRSLGASVAPAKAPAPNPTEKKAP